MSSLGTNTMESLVHRCARSSRVESIALAIALEYMEISCFVVDSKASGPYLVASRFFRLFLLWPSSGNALSTVHCHQ